jgi:hypothetical protein
MKFNRLAEETISGRILRNCAFVFFACNTNVNFTLEQCTKPQRGSRGIAVLCL